MESIKKCQSYSQKYSGTFFIANGEYSMLGRQDRTVYERAIYDASFRQHITPKFGPHFMHAHGAIFRASEPVYRTFTERVD